MIWISIILKNIFSFCPKFNISLHFNNLETTTPFPTPQPNPPSPLTTNYNILIVLING